MECQIQGADEEFGSDPEEFGGGGPGDPWDCRFGLFVRLEMEDELRRRLSGIEERWIWGFSGLASGFLVHLGRRRCLGSRSGDFVGLASKEEGGGLFWFEPLASRVVFVFLASRSCSGWSTVQLSSRT